MAGRIDPGNVDIVREILSDPAATDVDTAVFSGARSEYGISPSADTTAPTVGSRTPAADAGGVAVGTDVDAVFTEAVSGVSGTTLRLADPAGTAVAGAVTYDCSR